ncbi:penicillin-binding protein 2 [Candidatus Microgenomates bacterium]|nr:penicillin-binding protein 2 [Candidatus Microgenomates bacterium]
MWRIRFTLIFFTVLIVVIILRLFYWQVILSDKLSLSGHQQYLSETDIPAPRGEIRTTDNIVLVTNEAAFDLYVAKNEIKIDPQSIADKLAVLFGQEDFAPEATFSGMIKQPSNEDVKTELINKLTDKSSVWTLLFRKVPQNIKNTIESYKIDGLHFENGQKRFYPESSMSAQLLGFVGRDITASDKGYFGLEGFYDRELKGVPGMVSQEKDVYGRPIVIGEKTVKEADNGRTLVLHLDRTVQFIIEEKLREGLEKYGAKAGSVVVMDPTTGGIIGMSSFPSYDPRNWFTYDSSLYKNPAVADFYEPGSTFKTLVMSAGINEGVVTPETECDKCTGPREISGFTIRTWNNKYFPNSTMTQVLEHSDNTGMVFVQEKLGKEKYLTYLRNFGIGEKTGIDLEDEATIPLRAEDDWRAIDLATSSFGQGIAVTAIQLVRAVATIANGGLLLEPHVVDKVITPEGKEIPIAPKIVKRVISNKTAKIMTEMLINAVEKGEAKWAKPPGFRIAGKTGTAQIPVKGHYDETRTIASFIGFAPADRPKFVMLVRISEPTTSPYGSETAAPLFFAIAKDLFAYYGIGPQ